MSGSRQRTVGVLGGMGPAATADFFNRIVAAEAGRPDPERTRLIIDNNPHVPDRNEASAGRGRSPARVLAGMAQGLERAGAEFLVMPCNAAHAYEAEIRAATPLPFVSMIAATADAVRRDLPGARRVGVLAAGACLEAGLYQTALAERGLQPVTPDPQAQAWFMELLYRIKAGDVGQGARAEMADLAQRLAEAGAQALIAGCTEVPLVLSDANAPLPLVSSTQALVERTLHFANTGAP